VTDILLLAVLLVPALLPRPRHEIRRDFWVNLSFGAVALIYLVGAWRGHLAGIPKGSVFRVMVPFVYATLYYFAFTRILSLMWRRHERRLAMGF
jgi:hypothetical protein